MEVLDPSLLEDRKVLTDVITCTDKQYMIILHAPLLSPDLIDFLLDQNIIFTRPISEFYFWGIIIFKKNLEEGYWRFVKHSKAYCYLQGKTIFQRITKRFRKRYLD